MSDFETPAERQARLRALAAARAQREVYRRTASPAQADAIATVQRAAPGLDPAVKTSVASALADNKVDKQTAINMTTELMRRAAAERPKGWFDSVKSFAWEAIKAPVRVGLGVAESGAQMAQTMGVTALRSAGDTVGAIAGGDWGAALDGAGRLANAVNPVTAPLTSPNNDRLDAKNMIEKASATTLGAGVRAALEGDNPLEMQGDGFFPAGELAERRKKAEREARGYYIEGGAYRGSVGDDFAARQLAETQRQGINVVRTNTVGRLVANVIYEPGSADHAWLSGFADAGMAVFGDPFGPIAGSVAKASKAKKLFIAERALVEDDFLRIMGDADRIVTGTDGVRGVLRGDGLFQPLSDLAGQAYQARRTAMGLIDGRRGSVNGVKLDSWFQSRQGQRVVQAIADTTDAVKIFEGFGRKLDPEILQQLVDARTPGAVRAALIGALGRTVRTAASIDEIALGARRSLVRLPERMRPALERLGASVPTKYFDLDPLAPAAQQAETLANLLDFMTIARVDDAGKAKAFDAVLAAFSEGTSIDRFNAARVTTRVVKESVRSNLRQWKMLGKVGDDVLDKWVDDMFDWSNESMDIRRYFIDADGFATDGGFLDEIPFRMRGDSGEMMEIANAKLVGPGLSSEGLHAGFVLPDIRQIRGLVGKVGAFTRRGVAANEAAGTLNMPAAMVMTLQNDVWKPMQLLRGAFAVRVLAEEQVRMAAAGYRSILRHPIEYIMWATGNYGGQDLLGQRFVDGMADSVANKDWNAFARAMSSRGVKASGKFAAGSEDAIAEQVSALPGALQEEQMFRRGHLNVANRVDHPDEWVSGLADELQLLNRDPIPRMVASGYSTDEIVNWLRGPSKEGMVRYRELVVRGRTGLTAQIPGRAKPVRVFANLGGDVELRSYIDNYVRARVQEATGGNRDLLSVVARNEIRSATFAVPREDLSRFKVLASGDEVAFHPQYGEVFVLDNAPDGKLNIRANTVQAFKGGDTHEALTAALVARRLEDDAPDVVKYWEQLKPGETNLNRAALAALNGRDRVTRYMFYHLYGKHTDYLSRSTVFRQEYWRRVGELAHNLSRAEADRLLARINNASGLPRSLPAALADNVVVDDFYLTFSVNLDKLDEQQLAFIRSTLADNPGNSRLTVFSDGENLRMTDEFRVDADRVAAKLRAKFGNESIIGAPYNPEPPKITFQVNDWVRPSDRDNIGQIIQIAADDPDRMLVRFYNKKTEKTAQKWFHKGSLTSLMERHKAMIEPKIATPRRGAALNDTRLVLGEGEEFDQVRAALASADGDVTVAQLDEWAKAEALDKTRELLFDATSRNNFFDAASVVFPFGEAWREVLTTWANLMFDIQGPGKVKLPSMQIPHRFHQIVQGARGADPDGDGQGFFYRDPRSGEEVFTLPFSAKGIQVLSSAFGGGPGVETPFVMRVDGLNILGGVAPGVGPYVQMPLKYMIPDKPDYDEVRAMVFPFGEPDGFELVPVAAWLKKVQEGVAGDQNDRTYGDTYLRTLQVLLTSGEYDMRNPDDVFRIRADATSKAKALTVIRGLAQSFLPSSPAYDERIVTQIGKLPSSVLINEWNKLQREDYSTAVERFVTSYGQQAAALMVGRTRVLVGGLASSAEFADWQRSEGAGIVDDYKLVGGYFGPAGDGFDLAAYQRQLSSGQRVRVRDDELIAKMNQMVARERLQRVEAKLPPPPDRSEAQKAALRKFKQKLEQEYPGFSAVPSFNPSDFPRRIAELRRIVKDDRMAGNEAVPLVEAYLSLRDKALKRAEQLGLQERGAPYIGFRSKGTEQLRALLRAGGERLAARDSRFARLWEEVLSREVEQDDAA